MATDALDKNVKSGDVLVHRDGSLYIYQTSHTAFEMSRLGYAFSVKFNRKGILVETDLKPNIVRMYDALIVILAPDMKSWDKKTWQKWWSQEWRRGSGHVKLRENIKAQREQVQRLIKRREIGA